MRSPTRARGQIESNTWAPITCSLSDSRRHLQSSSSSSSWRRRIYMYECICAKRHAHWVIATHTHTQTRIPSEQCALCHFQFDYAGPSRFSLTCGARLSGDIIGPLVVGTMADFISSALVSARVWKCVICLRCLRAA